MNVKTDPKAGFFEQGLLKVLFPRISSMIQSGGRSSAMKPVLYLVSIVLICLWIAPDIKLGENLTLKAVVAMVFCLAVIVALFGFVFLLLKCPEKLQSERYQLAMRRMDIAAQRAGLPPSYVGGDNAIGVTNEEEKSRLLEASGVIVTSGPVAGEN